MIRFDEYSSDALLEQIKKYQRPNCVVTYTGGEPLIQKDFLKEFLPLARKNNFKNYLETNGTLPEALAEVIDFVDVVAMDVKLPSSSGQGPFWDKHSDFLKIAQQKDAFVKVVVCNSTEDADIHQLICMIENSHQAVSVVMQPDSGTDLVALKPKIDKYVSWCASEGIATCYIPQMHKMMGIK